MSTVTIRLVLDAAAALEDGDLTEHLSMIDDQRLRGSRGEATSHLSTVVSPGDTLIWSIVSIECEIHAGIQAITIAPEVCHVERHFYPDTNISYWTGTVQSASGDVPYEIVLEVGNADRLMTNAKPSLRVVQPEPLRSDQPDR